MGIQVRHQCLILVAGLFVFLTGLGAARLWDEDEPQYARVAREMMLQGEWLTPTFNFHLFSDKPVLLYWLMLGSYHVFGVTEFAARFPSAVMAIGTALLTYHLGRRLFRPQVGLWAGLIMTTNVMAAVIGRAATFDSTLVFVTTLCLLAYVVTIGSRAWSDPIGPLTVAGNGGVVTSVDRFRAVLPRSWWGFMAMYVPLGLGMMVKGPVGVLGPIAALGLFVLFFGSAKTVGGSRIRFLQFPKIKCVHCGSTRWTAAWFNFSGSAGRLRALAADFPAATWAMRPFSLAAIVLAVALPWYLLVSIRTGGKFPREFFLFQNAARLMRPMEGHQGSILYYPVVLVIFSFPWTIPLSLGAAKACRCIRESTKHRVACLLLATWSLAWIGLFSFSSTKLPHYIAPAFPALAVIAGKWIADWIAAVHAVNVRESTADSAQAGPATVRPGTPLMWEEGLGEQWLNWGWRLKAGIGLGALVALPLVTRHFAPAAPSCSWLGLIVLLGAAVGWLCQRRRLPSLVAGSMVVFNALLFVGLFGVAAVPISEQQSGVRMADSIRRLGTKSAAIGAYRLFLPGLFFYADLDHPIIQVKKPDDARRLFGPDQTSFLVTDADGFEELGPLIPDNARVVERQNRYLKRSELLLVESAAAGERRTLCRDRFDHCRRKEIARQNAR